MLTRAFLVILNALPKPSEPTLHFFFQYLRDLCRLAGPGLGFLLLCDPVAILPSQPTWTLTLRPHPLSPPDALPFLPNPPSPRAGSPGSTHAPASSLAPFTAATPPPWPPPLSPPSARRAAARSSWERKSSSQPCCRNCCRPQPRRPSSTTHRCRRPLPCTLQPPSLAPRACFVSHPYSRMQRFADYTFSPHRSSSVCAA